MQKLKLEDFFIRLYEITFFLSTSLCDDLLPQTQATSYISLLSHSSFYGHSPPLEDISSFQAHPSTSH